MSSAESEMSSPSQIQVHNGLVRTRPYFPEWGRGKKKLFHTPFQPAHIYMYMEIMGWFRLGVTGTVKTQRVTLYIICRVIFLPGFPSDDDYLTLMDQATA